jgi:F0F1-type ATP synthase assembly protein I
MENKQKLHMIGLFLIILSGLVGGLQFVISAVSFIVGFAMIFFPEHVEEFINDYRRDHP